MVDQACTVDLNKPLVFQVGHLGEAYDEWVHQPIVSKETPRFFKNDLLEFFTRTTWWVIPLIWLPISFWFVSSSTKDGLPPYHLTASIVFGILTWTLLEYSLHRFLFHMKTKGYWFVVVFRAFPCFVGVMTKKYVENWQLNRGNTVHYLLHGCHHKHPMDGLRLVFPPAAAAILAVPLWILIKILVPASYSPAFFGGGLVGYVMYDCTHYYLHHGKPLKGVPHELKRNHMHHHFKVQDKGFGITSNFWDRVFGTLPPKPAKKYS